MCGICGELITKTSADYHPSFSEKGVAKMRECLSMRGPDATGFFHQQPITGCALSLGHCRLSIIDLSQKSDQPMSLDGAKDNQFVLVFNGCIYNYRELRRELEKLGCPFFSQSDTEVILQAWRQWGEKSIERLDGMFAFAIWDPTVDALFLVRDRFGIKPLYYTINRTPYGNALRFASTLPALLVNDEVSHELNPEALHFMYHLHAVTPAPHTILRDIKKLPPAHYIKISANDKLQHAPVPYSYWHLPAKHTLDIPQQSMADWQKQTEELLLQAVKKRLLAADVPVGILLSGGLDSSLIVALADELKQRGQWQQDLYTYSIGFEDIGHEKGNEFVYSDQVVNQFKTQHHRYNIPNSQVLQRLDEAIESMSEPMFGQDCIAFYLLSEQVAQHTKVVLSGQGADEVFGGYFWFGQLHQIEQQYLSSHQHLTPSLSYQHIADHYIDRSHPEWLSMMQAQWQSDNITAQWFKQQIDISDHSSMTAELMRIDVTNLIVDDPVKRVDNMTMAWSLEARVPFLDTQLVEHANQIPIEYHLQHQGKGLLKNIAKRWFSDDFIFRKKGYFPMPALKYVRGEFLTKMSDALNSQAARERGLFKPTYLKQLLNNPEQHLTKLQGSKLWHCALLELWLQRHL